MITIDQQIKWLTAHTQRMQVELPLQVADGLHTQQSADYSLNTAVAALRTLFQLRGLTRAESASA